MPRALELRRQRAALVLQARNIVDNPRGENGDLSAEQLAEYNTRMADIQRLADQITRDEQVSALEVDLGQPAGQRSEQPAQPPERSFRSLGEFLYAVRFNHNDERLQTRAMSMGTGEEGGFNLPEQFRGELLKVSPEQAIVRPRATVIPAGDPPDAKVNMPALDQNEHGVYAGVTVNWIAEGGAKPETSPAFKEVSLEPKEVAAYVTVTDKLLRNWQASNAFVGQILRGAITASEDYKFLRGNGVGCPKGITDTAAKLAVARNAAASVKFVDVATMLSKMLPESLSRAVWVASVTTMPQIINLQDDAKATIFIRGDATKGIPDTLFGRPLIWTGKTPVLGNAADLMLCDFSYYLIKDGSGPFVAASEHVNFTTNKTVIKAFWNVDGDGWPAAPLLLEDGATTVSPFVVLT